MPTHLCVRSYFSLLDGTQSVEEIILSAKKMGYNSVALTDTNVLYGALDFAVAAKKHNIKPLFGMEVSIKETDTFQSLLLAKNNKGYQHLIKASSLLDSQGYITYDDILPFTEDIWFILYNERGPFESLLLNQAYDELGYFLSDIKNRFPEILIGISHQESPFFKAHNKKLVEIGNSLGIGMVALPKVYYGDVGDDGELKLLNAIKEQTYIEDPNLVSSPNRNFIDKEVFTKLYDKDLIEKSDEIAAQSNVDLFKITTSLPVFNNQNNVSNPVYIKELARYGLNKRLGTQINETYKSRLNYELDVIIKMDFVDYFLIVYDLIRFAKQSGIYVGPGRGSAAGSLVAYSLGITEVDPLKYDLVFERFLNPERISMPDIDIDFPDDKRQSVIDYVVKKYGQEHVAHIPTFGTLKAKQAFRDVARVFQVSLRKVDQVSRLIGNNTLEQAKANTKLKLLLESDDQLKTVYENALKIEGLPRHTSLHAAGIVLSNTPLSEVAPTFNLDESARVLQYAMAHLESIGLVKIDFLGLRNLTLIDRICHDIQEKNPNFNISLISLEDPKTFQLLRHSDTAGIFQLESKGMTKLLRDIIPQKFMDLVDVIALYRPGPMENIPVYLQARHHMKTIEYLHPDLEEITKSTYGILIYQEQIMRVAQKMAGFSLGRADILRKAMSKKDSKELESLREEFVKGCMANGYESVLSKALYELVFKFANYGFNKSHSVAYGLIAYQLAYLKANYSLLFYLHLLNNVIGSEAKTSEYLDESKNAHVSILGFHLEHSNYEYKVEGAKIRLPLNLIKGVSANTAKSIHQEVKTNGKFKSFFDAIARLNLIKVNSNQLEALIKAGAFDYFGESRLSLLMSLDDAMHYAKLITIGQGKQITLNPELLSEPMIKKAALNQKKVLDDEFNVLGFYFSDHPIKELRVRHKAHSIKEIVKGNSMLLIGVVSRIKAHRTKKGEPMAFINLSDDFDTIDVVVFPRVYSKIVDVIEVNIYVTVFGYMKEEGSFIAQEITKIEN